MFMDPVVPSRTPFSTPRLVLSQSNVSLAVCRRTDATISRFPVSSGECTMLLSSQRIGWSTASSRIEPAERQLSEPSDTDLRAARPLSKSGPIILSMLLNRLIALIIKDFGPVIDHVTSVPVPSESS